MPRIRLLTSVVGGPVEGAAGDEVEVDPATAAVWADGERAELVAPPATRTASPRGEQAVRRPPKDVRHG